MSRDRKPKKNPSTYENCITEQNTSVKERAIISSLERKEWEKNKSFEIKRIDSKTVFYKLIKDKKGISKKNIHKGII